MAQEMNRTSFETHMIMGDRPTNIEQYARKRGIELQREVSRHLRAMEKENEEDGDKEETKLRMRGNLYTKSKEAFIVYRTLLFLVGKVRIAIEAAGESEEAGNEKRTQFQSRFCLLDSEKPETSGFNLCKVQQRFTPNATERHEGCKASYTMTSTSDVVDSFRKLFSGAGTLAMLGTLHQHMGKPVMTDGMRILFFKNRSFSLKFARQVYSELQNVFSLVQILSVNTGKQHRPQTILVPTVPKQGEVDLREQQLDALASLGLDMAKNTNVHYARRTGSCAV